MNKRRLRLERQSAGPFGADERSRNIEAVLGQQLIQVVTRDTPSNWRKPSADVIRVPITQVSQPAVDLTLAASRRDDLFQLRFAGPTHPKSGTIVGQHL